MIFVETPVDDFTGGGDGGNYEYDDFKKINNEKTFQSSEKNPNKIQTSPTQIQYDAAFHLSNFCDMQFDVIEETEL